MRILIVNDDHLIRSGTNNMLQRQYLNLEIYIATTAQEAIREIQQIETENSVFDLIILEIGIPEQMGMDADIHTGIQLLKNLLHKYPSQNIMVHSIHVKPLVGIKSEIDKHQGGFVIADLRLPEQEILNRFDLAIQGITYIKDIINGREFNSKWLEVLRLKFNEGLPDKAIAEKMHISARTVRNYWMRIQDALNYPEI